MKMARVCSVFLIMFLLLSCDNEDKKEIEQAAEKSKETPKVQLIPTDFIITLDEASLTDGESKELTLTMKLGKKPDVDMSVKLALTPKNESDALYASALGFVSGEAVANDFEMKLAKGATSGSVKIKQNSKFAKRILANLTYQVKVSKVVGKEVDHTKIEGKELIFNKKADVPDLSAAQLGILEKHPYLKKWIGTVQVVTKVKIDGDNSGLAEQGFPVGGEDKTYTGTSVITLSDQASLTNPSLKIINNAMGLKDYTWMVFKKETLENDFRGKPANDPTHSNHKWLSDEMKAVWKAVNWTASTSETFDLSLDNLVLSPNAEDQTQGKVKFIEWKGVETGQWKLDERVKGNLVQYDQDIYAVNFQYAFSAWDRFMRLKDTDKALGAIYKSNVIDDGSGSDVLVDPNYFMYYTSNLRKSEVPTYAVKAGHPSDYAFSDGDWADDMSFAEGVTGSSYDTRKGEMKFKFMMDTQGSGDWMQVSVTYSIK